MGTGLGLGDRAHVELAGPRDARLTKCRRYLLRGAAIYYVVSIYRMSSIFTQGSRT